jgi:hypothetical protein
MIGPEHCGRVARCVNLRLQKIALIPETLPAGNRSHLLYPWDLLRERNQAYRAPKK